jgi:hypothetical protein
MPSPPVSGLTRLASSRRRSAQVTCDLAVGRGEDHFQLAQTSTQPSAVIQYMLDEFAVSKGVYDPALE